MMLGLTEAQFWEYTPHHVLTLWEFHLAAERRMDRRFGLIACMYANAHRDDKKHPRAFEIDDFVPGAKPVSAREANNNVVQMLAQAKALTLAAKAKREKLTPYQVVMAARDMATA